MIDLNKVRISLQDEDSSLSRLSKEMICDFYEKLPLNPYKDLWKKEFIFLYGDIENNVSSNKKIKPEELATIYSIDTNGKDIDLFDLFYSIQTFFSLFIRFVAYKLVSNVKGETEQVQNVKPLLLSILSGTYFEALGIKNYCYQDWFCWIAEDSDDKLEMAVSHLLNELNQYDTITEWVELSKIDHMKQMYETIIPRELRHALGEFYTPDWLADFSIEKVTKLSEGNGKKYLDPTCGSGTFLFKAIQQLRKNNPGISLDEITSSVRGFDVNPIAVLTAKTNYLIGILDFIKKETVVQIPVYNYDVIHYPKLKQNRLLTVDINDDVYDIPLFVIEEEFYPLFKKVIVEALQEGVSPDTFIHRLREKRMVDEGELRPLYAKLWNDKIGSIIASILLNRIEAYKLDKVDYIIGNPPWVNWEYLPKEYREKSQHLWVEYGLFAKKGKDLSFSKEDISILITYLVIDQFLGASGHVAFVINQRILKAKKNGIGFRRFRVGDDYDVKVKRVDDLSFIQPFENAATSTAVIFLQKNQPTDYPVPYYVWKKSRPKGNKKLSTYEKLEDVLTKITIKEMIAFPSDNQDRTSLWITIPKETEIAIQQVLGTNQYKARTGVFTGGANAVYWLEIKEKKENGKILVSNLVDRAKRKVDKVEREMEQDLVYPFVKGSNINQWEVKPEHYLLCPHTQETKIVPILEEIMKRDYPESYHYLLNFKEELNARKGFAGWEKGIQKQNFHAILRIGAYTFSPYKVVWRYIASEFITAVMSSSDDEYLGRKMLIPNEKVMYISLEDEEEAYYVCGILSSSPVAFCVKSYMNPTSISTHVLEKIKIEPFQKADKRHVAIAKLCKLGHQEKNQKEKEKIRIEINHIVAEIYHLNQEQMDQLT